MSATRATAPQWCSLLHWKGLGHWRIRIGTRQSTAVVISRCRREICRVVMNSSACVENSIHRSTIGAPTARLVVRMSTAIRAASRVDTTDTVATTAIVDQLKACSKKERADPQTRIGPSPTPTCTNGFYLVIQRRGRRELDAPQLKRGLDAEVRSAVTTLGVEDIERVGSAVLEPF